MKPIRIRFRCFGPYVEEQVIDFDSLAEYGLFLICGETGSGKTTILDAMCCALYGSCSGELRGDLSDMRCKQANPEDPTEVEFVFENAGERYRFERKLTPQKTKKAEIRYNEDNVCQVESAGGWIPLLDNCTKTKMNKKAGELIGFSLDQFRQVIILPQGRFETFLTSDSADKEAILSTIFHTERWEKAVNRMGEELRERKAGTARENQAIRAGLEKWQLSGMEDLPEALKNAGQAAEDAARAEKKANAELQQARALQELNSDFLELDSRRKNYDSAKQTADGDRPLRERLAKAALAEKARTPHDEWKQAEGKLAEADRQLQETEGKLKAAAAARAQAEEALQAHRARTPGQQGRENELSRLAALRTRYENIESLRKTAADAKKVLEEAKLKKELAGKAVRNEEAGLREAEKAWNDAEEAYRRISRAYRASAAGHLAESLREGEPCPVCGSVHHPSPAGLPEGSADSRDVEEADKKQTAARKAYENRRRRKEEADRAEHDADGACQKAEGRYNSENAVLCREMDQRDPELETLADLDRRSRELKSAIEKFNSEKESLNRIYARANAEFEALGETKGRCQERKAEAQEVFAGKEQAWKNALEETGLGTEAAYNERILSAEDQVKLQGIISEHAAALKAAETALNEQMEKVRGKDRPDSGTVGQVCRDAEQKHRETIRAFTLAEEKSRELAGDAKALTELDAKVGKKRQKDEEDTVFVNALQGSSGISIQRYVLSVRLGQVIVEANSLLSGIYGGRYRLHRSDESYGRAHKSGLELEVYDSMNDQRRSVCTLSGGEKFLVALSLAIGLCTVVQNEQRGVSLEAMFIDEGFGSLDQSALGDALDVLQGVRKGRGMVGIISHVALLEETVPTKIITEKTARGSRIRVKLG